MQVDDPQPSSGASNAFIDERVELFDFSRSPFTPERVEEILKRRSLMQGELFIDYMLRNTGIENPTELFPPSSEQTIRTALTAVKDANNPSIRLECIVYYLLSWWNGPGHHNFCLNKRIPSGFTELTYAYYLFDSGDYVRATTTLCNPRIRPDDALKVMQAIHLCPTIHPDILIHRYVTMAKPNLDSHHEIREMYARALARVSFVDAWLFQRSYADGQEDKTRESLVVVILNAILMPVPSKPALTALIAFPLDPSEEGLLSRYALNAPLDIPEHSLAALQDLIVIRFAQAGQYVKAVKLNREFANEMARANERGRKLSGWLASQKMEERRQMLRDIMSALPSVQRRSLEAQMGDATGGLSQASSFSGLEMSWETVLAPKFTPSVPRSLPLAPASVGMLPPPTPARTDEPQRVVLPNASPSTPAAAPTPIKTSNLGKGAKTPGRNARTPGRPPPVSGVPTPSFTPMQTTSATPNYLSLTPASPFTDRSGAPSPQSSFIARVGQGGVRDLTANSSINGNNVFDSPLGASPISNGANAPASVGGKNAFFDPSARQESPRGIILANVQLSPTDSKKKVGRKKHRLSEVFPPLDLKVADREGSSDIEADAYWDMEKEEKGDADVDMEEEQVFAAANLRTSRIWTKNALASIRTSAVVGAANPKKVGSPSPSVVGKRKRDEVVAMDLTGPVPPIKKAHEVEPGPEEEVAMDEAEQQEHEPTPIPEKKSRKTSSAKPAAVPTPRRSSRISKAPSALTLDPISPLDFISPISEGGGSTTESLPSPRMPGAFMEENEGQSQWHEVKTRSKHTRTLSGAGAGVGVGVGVGLPAVPEDAPLESTSPVKPPGTAGRPKRKKLVISTAGTGNSAEPSPVELKRESDEESMGSAILPRRSTRRPMAVPGGFTSSPPRSATPQSATSATATKKSRTAPTRTISTRSRIAQ